MQASKLLVAALLSFNLVACVVGDNDTELGDEPDQRGSIVHPLPDDLHALEPDTRHVIVGGDELRLDDTRYAQELVPDRPHATVDGDEPMLEQQTRYGQKLVPVQPRANPLDAQAALEPQP